MIAVASGATDWKKAPAAFRHSGRLCHPGKDLKCRMRRGRARDRLGEIEEPTRELGVSLGDLKPELLGQTIRA